ncbi:MFS transporter [Candidatus Poribacteria bacterium]
MSFREDSIYVSALMMDMGTGSIMLGVTFFASSLGASPLAIGLTASAYRLLYVIFCQVFGRLSDRVSRKRLTQIACLSFAILQLFVPFSRRLYQLVVLFPLTGIVLAALWPAMEAWVAERKDGRTLVRRVSIFNLSWTGGLMMGYVGGGYIGYVGGVQARALFYFASVAALFATAIITAQPYFGNGNRKEENRDPEAESCKQQPPEHQLATRYLYLSWAANCVTYLTLSIIRYMLPKFIRQQAGELGITLRMAPLRSGLMMLCQVAAQFVMFFILGRTEKWHYKLAPLLVFQVLASFGFLLIWRSNSPRFWIAGLIIIGTNVGMTYFSSIYYSLCGDIDLGGKSGWHESILHSGTVIGPSIGGALASYAGLKSPYLFCAAAIIVGLPIQIFILRKRSKDA